MSDELSGLQMFEHLRKLDDQKRIERENNQAGIEQEVDREVQKALDTTFYPGWGLIPKETARARVRSAVQHVARDKRAALQSTEPGQHRAGLAFAAVGLGVGGLVLWSRHRSG